jgi:hypothetical protein
MTILPQTTPVPENIVVFMPPTSRSEASASAGAPTPSAVPPGSRADESSTRDEVHASSSDITNQIKVKRAFAFPQPKLRLEVRDLAHEGSQKFFGAINASDILAEAVGNVLRLLYLSPSEPHTHAPPTRSVTLILRDMDGVA